MVELKQEPTLSQTQNYEKLESILNVGQRPDGLRVTLKLRSTATTAIHFDLVYRAVLIRIGHSLGHCCTVLRLHCSTGALLCVNLPTTLLTDWSKYFFNKSQTFDLMSSGSRLLSVTDLVSPQTF